MPTFKLTIQRDLTPESPRRRVRGIEHESTSAETFVAPTLIDAVRELTARVGEAGWNPRIVAVEEISTFASQDITDEQIAKALTEDCDEFDRLDPDEFDDQTTIYVDIDFEYLAQRVQRCLSTSGLVPGLELSLLHAEGGGVEYTMVEVYDHALKTYRSKGCELKHLTDNRDATGFDGVIAIARALINTAQDLM